jgi:DNA (cytosine-5)-methyltransferase 1
MKHYGDISKLNGADLPPVDIITFGSPCTICRLQANEPV